jgi:hypothetical protein
MQNSQRFKLKYTALASLCAGLAACGGGTTSVDETDPNAVTVEEAEARIDRVQPTLSVTAPTTTGSVTTTQKSVVLSGLAKDNRQVARVTWVTDKGASGRATQSGAADQVTWSSGSITLPTGTNRITVRAYDRAGNVATQSVAVTVSESGVAAPPPVASAPAATPAAPTPAPAAPAPAPVVSTPAPVASTPAAPAPAPVASTPAPAPASASGLTFIDTSIALPTGYAGVNTALIQSTTLQPIPAGVEGRTGFDNFRTVCTFSHMAYDDPIVFPGQPGASHLHSFFGNSALNASTTTASILTGASTCRGGSLNRSGYWVPAMVDANGRPRAPEDLLLYYKAGYQGGTPENIIEMPAGLRMIAGDSKSQTAQDHVYYACDSWQPGQTLTNDYVKSIPTCGVGQQLIMKVEFPSCWDGVNLDSPDHKSHMAYGDGVSGCPATHPRQISVITEHVKYKITAGTTAGWRLSSDVVGAPAGSSGHADWFNGWDAATVTKWITNCTHKRNDCGTYLLGNGQMITGGEAN